MNDTATKLRSAAAQLRVKPIPLATLIPLLLEAADRMERLQMQVASRRAPTEPVLDVAPFEGPLG